MIARTAWFDGLFLDALNNKIPQIVLLGAGYDSRGFRYAKYNSSTKVIELDTATTQNRKKKFSRSLKYSIPAAVDQ